MSMEVLHTIPIPVKLGGHVALDFTNTAGQHGTERFAKFIASYDQLLAWCWRSDLLSDAEAEQLHHAAEQRAQEANQIHQRALELRETTYELFSAVSNGHDPQSIDLTLLNEMLRQAQPHHQLAAVETGFSWAWNGANDDLERPLWSLVLVAAELLASESLSRLRKCPNCGWLFLDTSRNGLRRWCSMDYCGSQVKSRRQYERKKAAGASHTT